MTAMRAFTLIEVLIALVVFAILATITSSAMYYAFTTRTRVTEQAERLMDLQLAISLIERDISQIANRPVRGDSMQLFPAFVGKAAYVELTRGGMSNPGATEKRSTMKRVAILCENGQLIRRSWAVLDAPLRANFENKVLLNHISACHFSYLNDHLQLLNEWRANTLPNKPNSLMFPKAVQLSLTLSDWGKGSFLFILPEGLYAKK